MADAREHGHEHADGRVRDRGPARGRGDDHARSLPVTTVTLYQAPGCHLCERALEILREAREETCFVLELVDIAGDPELERRYREHLPVVEIDGERAFTYFVEPSALRARLTSS